MSRCGRNRTLVTTSVRDTDEGEGGPAALAEQVAGQMSAREGQHRLSPKSPGGQGGGL